jgi:hypothetical protein
VERACGHHARPGIAQGSPEARTEPSAANRGAGMLRLTEKPPDFQPAEHVTCWKRARNVRDEVRAGQHRVSRREHWSEVSCRLRPTTAKRISAIRTFSRSPQRFWLASSRSSNFPWERGADSKRSRPRPKSRENRQPRVDPGEAKWRRGERV